MTGLLKAFLPSAVCCCLVFGCGPENEAGAGDCLSQQPKDLKGLAVRGVRSRSNVVHELWKLICPIREYHRSQKPQVAGSMQVKLTVDYNGEVGAVQVLRSDIDDEQLKRRVVRILESAEFSYWGQEKDDTEVTYTFSFEAAAP